MFHRTKNLNFSLFQSYQRSNNWLKEFNNKRNMINVNYINIAASMMVILITLINQTIIVVGGDNQQHQQQQQKQSKTNRQITRIQQVLENNNIVSGREEFDKNLNVLQYNNWDREDVISSENDINSNIRGIYKSQNEYSCGRAIAQRKYKDFFLKDHQSYHITRSKYRPTEIRMPRIIGGDETAPGEFPWTVSVKLNGQPICGGSLIDKSWILTAAHCVVGYNPKNLTVRLGAYRIKDTSETQTLDMPVSMFIVHKEYSMPRPFSNDIALLKLNDQIEFTDFIIPICLPTEDQAPTATTTTTAINDDYSISKFETGKELPDDSGGIVVSTKMSDTDIADCFNKLEQNYLISIGLGPIAEATTTEQQVVGGSQQQQQQPQLHAPMKAVLSTSRPPVLPILPQHSSNQMFSYGSFFEPSFTTADNKVNQDNNKLNTFSTQIKQSPAGQHFDEIPHFSLPANTISGGSYNGQHGDFVYYGIPWKGKNNYLPESSDGSSLNFNFNKLARKEAIKLSRLPISKELLKEIQSIGSGPMPSLNLALQKGDLVSMASDLTATTPSSNNPQVNTDRGRPNKLTNKHLLRVNDILGDEETQETQQTHTEYSGLDGIVVGWGWVRELDSDDQVNNKGYPSVTLQKVRLPILRNNVCEAWFQSQSKKITLLPSQFCAGFNSGGKDACRVSVKLLNSLDRLID